MTVRKQTFHDFPTKIVDHNITVYRKQHCLFANHPGISRSGNICNIDIDCFGIETVFLINPNLV